MATLPTGASINLSGGVEYVSQPSRTWFIEQTSGRIVGECDGYEAEIAVKRFCTDVERYRWQIFQPYSGMEWEGLLGQDPGYVAAELQRRLEEALTVDDRVTGVKDFSYTVQGQALTASFTVSTIYGEMQASTEVNTAA